MARVPEEREDLLRDAKAYVQRVQLKLERDEHSDELFAGFRRCGAASFYFDQDPVYHFNTDGKLRRAFVAGKLIKAEAGTLVVWTRQNSAHEVAMLRTEMTNTKQAEFCQTAARQLANLRQAISTRAFEVMGEVRIDAGASVVDAIAAFLDRLAGIEIAASPRVAG